MIHQVNFTSYSSANVNRNKDYSGKAQGFSRQISIVDRFESSKQYAKISFTARRAYVVGNANYITDFGQNSNLRIQLHRLLSPKGEELKGWRKKVVNGWRKEAAKAWRGEVVNLLLAIDSDTLSPKEALAIRNFAYTLIRVVDKSPLNSSRIISKAIQDIRTQAKRSDVKHLTLEQMETATRELVEVFIDKKIELKNPDVIRIVDVVCKTENPKQAEAQRVLADLLTGIVNDTTGLPILKNHHILNKLDEVKTPEQAQMIGEATKLILEICNEDEEPILKNYAVAMGFSAKSFQHAKAIKKAAEHCLEIRKCFPSLSGSIIAFNASRAEDFAHANTIARAIKLILNGEKSSGKMNPIISGRINTLLEMAPLAKTSDQAKAIAIIVRGRDQILQNRSTNQTLEEVVRGVLKEDGKTSATDRAVAFIEATESRAGRHPSGKRGQYNRLIAPLRVEASNPLN